MEHLTAQDLPALYASLFALLEPLRAAAGGGPDPLRLLFHDVAARVYGIGRMQALSRAAAGATEEELLKSFE